MTSDECAVWYLRFGGADYELCDNEQEAVYYAYALEDAEEGAVEGVQFADGRVVEGDEWQALAEYETERYRAWRDKANSDPVPPTPPTRKVRDPFNGQQVIAKAAEPDWLGS